MAKRAYHFDLDEIDGKAQERAETNDAQYLVMAILAVAERLEGIDLSLERLAHTLAELRNYGVRGT